MIIFHVKMTIWLFAHSPVFALHFSCETTYFKFLTEVDYLILNFSCENEFWFSFHLWRQPTLFLFLMWRQLCLISHVKTTIWFVFVKQRKQRQYLYCSRKDDFLNRIYLVLDDQLNVKPGTPLNMEIFLDSESAAIYGLLGRHSIIFQNN